MKTQFLAQPHSIALKPYEGAKGIIITEMDAGEECVVAQLFDNYLDNVNRIHRHAEMFIRLPKMLQLLNRVVTDTPAVETDEEVDGADLVEWFASFRVDTKAFLAEAECAIVESNTDAGIQALQHFGDTDGTSVLPVPNRDARSVSVGSNEFCKCANRTHIVQSVKHRKTLEQDLMHVVGLPERVLHAGKFSACGAPAYDDNIPAMPVLFINVRCLSATTADPDDGTVEGKYKVTFDPDAIVISMAKRASIALDVFQKMWAINEIDNFEILILDQHDQSMDQDLYRVNGTGSGFASVEKVNDVPSRFELKSKHSSEFLPGGMREKIGNVIMEEIVGEYDVPSQVREWAWVEQHSSFSHNRNGQEGVWEFVLNLSLTFDGIPQLLKPVLAEAISKKLSYLIFRQST